MAEIVYPTIVTSRRTVPNFPPAAEPSPYRIALIGEAPGEKEEEHRMPFVGPSGNHLDRELRESGIDRNRCFVGNICQVRPPGNRIAAFRWDGPEIQDGLAALTADLAAFDPNICILMGNTPLHAAKANTPLGKPITDITEGDEDTEDKKYPFKISAWRGSLFIPGLVGPFYGRKCIPTLHPAAILRKFSGNPLFNADLKRARGEGSFKELHLPQRELLTDLCASELCYLMDTWPAGVPCSVDIEGGIRADYANDNVKADAKKRRHLNWKCVGLSGRPTKAFSIPWWRFSIDEHCALLRSFAILMERMDVPKVLQNSLYDKFVLFYSYNINVRNVIDDTMLKGWEIYCELPKSLGVQASVWTREPHWKDDEMYGGTGMQLATGCCKDVAVTLELSNAQSSFFVGDSKEMPHSLRQAALQHYRTNMDMLNPALYMEFRGMRYNTENVKKQLEATQKEISLLGDSLATMVGMELRGKKGSLSAQRLAKALYEIKKYPPQYKKENGRRTTALTTDQEALLTLRKRCPGDGLLDALLRHRHLEGIVETLNIKPDIDGRVRCSYNVVGTDTGRFACKTSPTGAGANLTTITKKLRLNYTADPQYDFFQADLAGADGWTVAAHCYRLGDDTMLEDYYFGLKPAQILSLLYAFGSDVNALSRDDLKWWSKKNSDKTGPFDLVSELVGTGIYDCCKVVQHGRNYKMGIPTMQVNVMRKSFKESGTPIYMEHSEGVALTGLYSLRYRGLESWHTWALGQLQTKGYLTSASGHTRKFFGRRWGRDIEETLRQFLADEPQQNTTWSTNLAMLRLWNDPENRRGGLVIQDAGDTYTATMNKTIGGLIIEPLHQVHDALCGQWPKLCRDWARAKVKSYFDNPLTIAGTKLVIPFEGNYGPSWGETPYKL